VYLSDFGIARAVGSGTTMTSTGTLLGTIDYIAPEQARGDQIDARADVYSLGCVLFEAVSGTVPYPRESEVAKLFAHASEPPPSLRQRSAELPAELDRVVSRAMAKSPEERYLSAGDFGRAAVAATDSMSLSRAERSVATGEAAPQGAEAVPPRTPPATRVRAARASRRRPAILAGLLVGLVAIAAVVIVVSSGGSSRHSCGQMSFAAGASLSSSHYGVGNIAATNTGCSVARNVAADAKQQRNLRYTSAGFTCTGVPTESGPGPHTEWRCVHGDAIATFYSIGV
jgi:hypothetical protein